MARHFNGTSDQLLSSSTISSSSPSALSMAGWWNPDVLPSTTVSVVMGVANNDFEWGGAIASRQQTWHSTAYLSPTAAMSVLTWYHIAYTWDGIVCRSYVNGSFLATATVTIPWAANFRTYVSEAFNSSYVAGTVADVAWWSTALSADQIAVLANGFRANHVRPDNMMVYWPILGQSPEPDKSGNGITGTVTGTTIVADPPQLEPWQPTYYPSAASTGTILVLPAQDW